MKKFFSIIIACLLILATFGFAGCGKDKASYLKLTKSLGDMCKADDKIIVCTTNEAYLNINGFIDFASKCTYKETGSGPEKKIEICYEDEENSLGENVMRMLEIFFGKKGGIFFCSCVETFIDNGMVETQKCVYYCKNYTEFIEQIDECREQFIWCAGAGFVVVDIIGIMRGIMRDSRYLTCKSKLFGRCKYIFDNTESVNYFDDEYVSAVINVKTNKKGIKKINCNIEEKDYIMTENLRVDYKKSTINLPIIDSSYENSRYPLF